MKRDQPSNQSGRVDGTTKDKKWTTTTQVRLLLLRKRQNEPPNRHSHTHGCFFDFHSFFAHVWSVFNFAHVYSAFVILSMFGNFVNFTHFYRFFPKLKSILFSNDFFEQFFPFLFAFRIDKIISFLFVFFSLIFAAFCHRIIRNPAKSTIERE
jgi:hypothetical protein